MVAERWTYRWSSCRKSLGEHCSDRCEQPISAAGAWQSRRLLLLGGHCQQMRAEPDNGHFALQCARDAEQVVPFSGIGPTVVEVRQDPSGTFEPEHHTTVETRRRYL